MDSRTHDSTYPFSKIITGRSGSGGGGVRVGSYTPASYGSVTTFGPSSYQYRPTSAQGGAGQPATVTLIQPMRKADSHDGGFNPSSSLPASSSGAAAATATNASVGLSPPNATGGGNGGGGRNKKKKKKGGHGQSPPPK